MQRFKAWTQSGGCKRGRTPVLFNKLQMRLIGYGGVALAIAVRMHNSPKVTPPRGKGYIGEGHTRFQPAIISAREGVEEGEMLRKTEVQADQIIRRRGRGNDS
jgi:hypothetical protein